MGEFLDHPHIRGARVTKIPIILLGFGHVGQALARLIEQKDGFATSGKVLTLVAVFDRGGIAAEGELSCNELVRTETQKGTLAEYPVLGKPGLTVAEVLANHPGAILVDATPTDPETGEPGLSLVRDAIERGHSVVMASKGPLVASFEDLMNLARARGTRLGFSAAVGIPLPSLETVLVGLHGCTLRGFRGLFNETSNRILRAMEAGVSYDDAIEEAHKAGVLETDPRLDLEGWDTAFKVLILARSFWDPKASYDPSSIKGITEISAEEVAEATKRGQRIRLLGGADVSSSGDIEIRVEPVRLEVDDPLYVLEAGEKGAVFDTDLMGRLVIRSGKAGPFATAAAIVKDILNIVDHPPHLAV